MNEVQLRGLQELHRALDTLPDKIQQNVLRGAMRAGAKVMAQQAKAMAPRGRSGRLGRSIRYSSQFDRKAQRMVGRASSGKGSKGRANSASAFYARFVEFGTKPHTIKANPPRKILAIGVPSVRHPGSMAKPFMRQAFAQSKIAATTAAASYMRKRLATKHGINVPDIEGDLEAAP